MPFFTLLLPRGTSDMETTTNDPRKPANPVHPFQSFTMYKVWVHHFFFEYLKLSTY